MTRREAPVSPPVVLTIAGSDSGGGAGIQADIKTIEATGGFGTSAITSVTAQNTRGVQDAHLLPVAAIRAQIEAVRSDIDVAAVKTGMLATADVVEAVAEYAPDLPNLVVDPVMVAASGDRLLDRDAEDAYDQLVAEATLVTPNADEAAVLTGVAVEDEESARRAGSILVAEHGARAALVKGGHVPGDTVVDVLVTPDGATTITHDRVDTTATHGSGCTLSSAIATALARGRDLRSAVTSGIALLGRAVRYNVDLGEGPGPVHHLVELRDHADRGDTVSSMLGIPERIGADTLAALGGANGVSVVGATPYAEEPADLAVLAVEADGECSPSVELGAPGPLGTLLLGLREETPAIRFGLSCPRTDEIAAAIDGLNGPVPEVHGEDGAPPSDVRAGITRAVEAVGESPVAMTLTHHATEPKVVILAESIEDLLERTRTTADGLR